MTTTKHPNRRMKATLATILTIAVLTGSNLASANAQNCRSDGFGGIRCSDGGGWRSDGFGGLRGTGNNSGSGWRSDGFGETECIDNLYRLREVLVSISYKIPAMPPLVDVYGPGETIFYNALDSKNRGDYAYCVSETKRALDVLSPYANF